MWTVAINKTVSKKISRIPEPEKSRIKQALKDLETKHEQLDIKPLVGRDGYRMLASRGDVYKK